MRLSKFLTLSIPMSRNQAKFFIRKRRLSVDGKVVTDPNSELREDSHVVFDGKQISIAGYQYIVLHKPPSYACTSKDSEFASVLQLIKTRSENRSYYFANALGPEQTGLVLLSDDARWANRMRRKLSKKAFVYLASLKGVVSECQIPQIKEAMMAFADKNIGTIIDVQRHDETSLLLSLNQVLNQNLLNVFYSSDLIINSLHLQKMGVLSLGDLKEGDYLELTENEIKV